MLRHGYPPAQAYRRAEAIHSTHFGETSLFDPLQPRCSPEVLTASSTTLGQLVPARLLVGVGSATGGTVGTATTAYTMDVVGKYPEHSGVIFGAIQVLARIHCDLKVIIVAKQFLNSAMQSLTSIDFHCVCAKCQ